MATNPKKTSQLAVEKTTVIGKDDFSHLIESDGVTNTSTKRPSILDSNHEKKLSYYSAILASGGAVSFACFGDSTTDGNETTSWTANPVDGSGNAVGNSDHEATAPNAWPKQLKTLLELMYPAATIEVWNAGYSGKRLDNGWAYDNYDTAVTNNPYYGTPDVCFIGFGLNDISIAGSQALTHYSETYKLCAKLLRAGTLPVLLTCDPFFRTSPDIRDHKESSREIDTVKFQVADELSIPVIDMGMAVRLFFERNSNGIQWGNIQADALHVGDFGHSFKAQVIAKDLFRDVVRVEFNDHRPVKVFSWDSRSAYVGDYAARYLYSNTAQAGNVVYLSSAPTATDMMTMWVWNESPWTELIYRGVGHEYYESTGLTNAPKVSFYNPYNASTTEKTPAGVGFTGDTAWRQSDIPYRFGKMTYGLSLVKYKSGTSGTLFYGSFELGQAGKSPGISPLVRRYPTGANVVTYHSEMENLSNVFGLFDEQKAEMFFHVFQPQLIGIVIASGTGYGGVNAINQTRKNFLLLQRKTTDKVSLYRCKDISGVISFVELVESAAALTWTTAERKWRVTIQRVSDVQQIRVYDGVDTDTVLLSHDIALSGTPVTFGGAVGGLYFAGSGAGASTTGQLLSCSVYTT